MLGTFIGHFLLVATFLVVGDSAATVAFYFGLLGPEPSQGQGMAFMCVILMVMLLLGALLHKSIGISEELNKLTKDRESSSCGIKYTLLVALRFANPICVAFCLCAAWCRCIAQGWKMFIAILIVATALAIVAVVSQCRIIKLIRDRRKPDISLVVHVISYVLFLGAYAIIRFFAG